MKKRKWKEKGDEEVEEGRRGLDFTAEKNAIR